MKVHILGSCSGTEPMPGRRHTAIALETAQGITWLDAGEGCSHTAHTMGLDLLTIQRILISHPHMDHVGGLGNLLWTIRKLCNVQKRSIDHTIRVYLPSKHSYEGIMQVLSETEGRFQCDFLIEHRPVADGLLFAGPVSAQARHNLHLGAAQDGNWQSFSYRIESEGKSIVFSGDVASIEELDGWLDCDLLMMETGHHVPAQCAEYLAEKAYKGTLLFVHHGRHILENAQDALRKAKDRYPGRVLIAHDRMTLEAGVDF